MLMDEQGRQIKAREMEEQSTQGRAGLLNIPYIDARTFEETLPLVNGALTIKEMYDLHTVPLRESDENGAHDHIFGMTTATPQSTMKTIEEKYAQKHEAATFLLISESGYRNLMHRYDPPKEVVYNDIAVSHDGDSDTLAEVSKSIDEVLPADMLHYLVDQADRLGASDIHFETEKNDVRIRMRIDGALHPVATLTEDKYRSLLLAIASQADISTAETKPQSGHMLIEIPEQNGKAAHSLNMRIETVQTNFGMDIVVRLFNFDNSMLNFDVLGLTDEELDTLKEIVKHPRGMVLTVGPTGSGKSTTIYSILNALNDTGRKIITLEDPVEYSIPGVTQIPINTNDETQTFADNLRAVLRLDPNVVMIGEIRDADTAKTAIQASITGHLVLATFHAETAAAAFTRMVDMIGVNPIFSTAIRVIIGQRLVRRLDDATKTPYKPDEATVEWIRKNLENLPEDKKPDLSDITLYNPGKSEENPFGFKGRIVLMEQLTVTTDIQQYLRGEAKDVTEDAIEAAAIQDGMITMLQKGILRALAGDTTIEEINKVL